MAESIYNPEFVRNLFNRMSGSYERMNYITSFGFSHRWRRQSLQHIIKEESNLPLQVIDLMTGMGETWSSINRRFGTVDLTALDFSSGMLAQAAKRNARHYACRVRIEQQDMLLNALPDNQYDIVVCAYGLKTFDSAQLSTLASETYRILKPNGQFVFIEVSEPSMDWLRFLYSFYLQRVIPILGRLLLGNPVEYRMLWEYTSRFGNAQKAAAIFQQAGLTVVYDSYFWGCATGFHGRKPN